MTEVEKQQQEIDALNAELAIRDKEIKDVVLAISGGFVKLGVDFGAMKEKGFMAWFAESGLLPQIMAGVIDLEEVFGGLSALAPIFEKYQYLVEDDLKLIANESNGNA